jgi:hypothetical protein
MTKFFSTASAATKVASLVVVVVVASTVLLVVYNTNSTAWHDATRSEAGAIAGNKNHHGLYSASVNSIAQQRQLQQQLQQQLWHQRRWRQRRRTQQSGSMAGGEVTVGGWHNYDADTASISPTTHTSNTNTDHHDTENPLYETETTPIDNDNNNEQLYSSSPFHPRQYTGTGTSYMHYKHSKEQDTDGYTTFPPTYAPIVQYSGWFQPTLGPSLLENESSNEPTLAPSMGPTLIPSRSPTKYPIMITLEPTKEEKEEDDDDDDEEEEEVENEWLKTDEPTMVPSLAPITEPTGSPSKVPTLGVSCTYSLAACMKLLWSWRRKCLLFGREFSCCFVCSVLRSSHGLLICNSSSSSIHCSSSPSPSSRLYQYHHRLHLYISILHPSPSNNNSTAKHYPHPLSQQRTIEGTH